MANISKEFKNKFNDLTAEINRMQDGRGKFRLTREFDLGMQPLIKKAIALCDQYDADQKVEIPNSTDFMGICKVEY